MPWLLFAFSILWTAVASAAITTIVIRRRAAATAPAVGARVGTPDAWPVPSWVPPSDQLVRVQLAPPAAAASMPFAAQAIMLPAPAFAPAHAVTLRVVVPDPMYQTGESWERDETAPREMPIGSGRLPSVA
jgi:hypothetical protein